MIQYSYQHHQANNHFQIRPLRLFLYLAVYAFIFLIIDLSLIKVIPQPATFHFPIQFMMMFGILFTGITWLIDFIRFQSKINRLK
ncbi:hypothetical protein [Seinonella peptonophila]|uniref:hypothetical protein n=1 Tax=Seinonella peptonophila TaxID=112248 RepID=UPI0009350A3F|nr:hypothetical protein [Seinonella peptonophila]